MCLTQVLVMSQRLRDVVLEYASKHSPADRFCTLKELQWYLLMP